MPEKTNLLNEIDLSEFEKLFTLLDACIPGLQKEIKLIKACSMALKYRSPGADVPGRTGMLRDSSARSKRKKFT